MCNKIWLYADTDKDTFTIFRLDGDIIFLFGRETMVPERYVLEQKFGEDIAFFIISHINLIRRHTVKSRIRQGIWVEESVLNIKAKKKSWDDYEFME